MIITSKLQSAVRYGGRDGVLIVPGVNHVTDDQMDVITESRSFRIHAKGGFLVEGAIAEQPKPVRSTMQMVHGPQNPTPPEPPALPPNPHADFLAAYDAMSEKDQTDIYPTLAPDERAAIDARKK